MKQAEPFGPQYSGDDAFKASARFHQSKFRKNFLKAGWTGYGNRLCKRDALLGKNFYSDYDVFEAACSRYPLKYSPLFYDMLRSEHIPFNFFGPLVIESEFAVRFLNSLLDAQISSISQIKFEHRPPPIREHLGDNTAFDVFICYRHRDGSEGVFGVEVKFTEREYSFGQTERKRIANPKSRYNVVSNNSGIYLEDINHLLKTLRLKQFWRNQLLGESLLQYRVTKIRHFTSVHLFPAKNDHMSTAASEYSNCIIEPVRNSKFQAVTFERFLDVARENATSTRMSQWISYLSERYIVDN